MPWYFSWVLWAIIKNGTRGKWTNFITLKQNGRPFPDDILKCIFLNENVWILIKISLKFVLKGPISNIPALVQIMAWRRPGDKPLSEPMMVSFQTVAANGLSAWNGEVLYNYRWKVGLPGSGDTYMQQLTVSPWLQVIECPYHRFAMREVSVNPTSLYETN